MKIKEFEALAKIQGFHINIIAHGRRWEAWNRPWFRAELFKYEDGVMFQRAWSKDECKTPTGALRSLIADYMNGCGGDHEDKRI